MFPQVLLSIMNSDLLFSIVIPTYHRNDLLAKCLDCLAPDIQTLKGDRYEVIVSDDGCLTTAEIMIREQYPWVKWVIGPRKGPAANRNNGAKYALGDWLVFTDDDCLPDPQWLDAYGKAISNNKYYSVFEGRTYVDRPRQSLAETSPINESGGYLWSCNFCISMGLFKLLGGFDERFPYAAMEDVDLRLRLNKSGHKFMFTKSASVCHPWRYIGGWKKLKQHQKATLIYLSIHPDESSRINSIYYLRCTLHQILRVTIPSIFKLQVFGLYEHTLQIFSYLQMAFILSYQKNHPTT
jgi:GT2 family glycosyltransferase